MIRSRTRWAAALLLVLAACSDSARRDRGQGGDDAEGGGGSGTGTGGDTGGGGAAASGGNGGAGGEGGGASIEGLHLHVAFPTELSSTQQANLTVVGMTASEQPVSSVSVGGVPAVSSDGFRHWTAQVDLEPGANTIEVTATSPDGVVTTELTVHRQAELDWVLLAQQDPTSGDLWFVDNVDQGARVSRRTANEAMPTVLLDQLALGGPFALDLPHNRLLELSDGVRTVDLETGAIEVVSPSYPAGQFIDDPLSLTVDPATGLVYILDGDFDEELYRLNVETGQATRLTDLSPYTSWIDLVGVLFDTTTSSVLVITDEEIVRVNASTGSATTIYNSWNLGNVYLGQGKLFILPGGSGGTLTTIDIASGGSTSTQVGSSIPSGHPVLGAAVPTFFDNGVVTAWDPVSLQSSTVFKPYFPTSNAEAPAIQSVDWTMIDSTRNRLVLASEGNILTIDAATGDRVMLSESNEATWSWGGLYDPLRDQYVVGGANEWTIVDPVTGGRSTKPGSPGFNGQMEYLNALDRYVVGTNQGVAAYDPDTGASVTLSSGEQSFLVGVSATLPVAYGLSGSQVIAFDFSTQTIAPLFALTAAGTVKFDTVSEQLITTDGCTIFGVPIATGVPQVLGNGCDDTGLSLYRAVLGGGDVAFGFEPRVYMLDYSGRVSTMSLRGGDVALLNL